MQIENAAVVLVTGAHRGIGLEHARELLARGARKVCACHTQPRDRQTLRGVHALQLDVTKPGEPALAKALRWPSKRSDQKGSMQRTLFLEIFAMDKQVNSASRRQTAPEFRCTSSLHTHESPKFDRHRHPHPRRSELPKPV